MKRTLVKLWSRVRRNPVVVAFVAAVAAQVWQDWVTNQIDWGHFFGYLLTVCLGIIAREKVTPTRSVLEKIESDLVKNGGQK